MKRRILVALIAGLALSEAVPVAGSGESAFQEARELEASGQLDEAFLAYLRIPGARYLAARMARPRAAHYLKLVRERADVLPPTASRLLEGDLLLATDQRDAALACYRAVASASSRETYFVEPPSVDGEARFRAPLAPSFSTGPGSHRDNWLIRRFIALDAVEDAAAEFARVWEIHRRNARSYRADVVVGRNEDGPVLDRRLVVRAGFDRLGLQFALHYAFFLKRAGKPEQGLAVLREPVRAMDMDRDPNRTVLVEVGPGDADRHPLRRGEHLGTWYGSGRPSHGMSRKEFVRLAYGVFKGAGRESALVEMLQKEIADGEFRLCRVLARVRLHQGRADDALAEELAYIERADLDALSVAVRRGEVFESSRKLPEAVAAYEEALALPHAPLRLPDADEEIAKPGDAWPGWTASRALRLGSADEAAFRAEMLRRLVRLYGALARPHEAFQASLRALEIQPSSMRDLQALQRVQVQAEALGRRGPFLAWLRNLGDGTDSSVRANVCWLLADYAGLGCAVGAAWTAEGDDRSSSYDHWHALLGKAGREPLRAFLTALLEVHPQNALVRLDLLDLEGRLRDPAAIPVFEALSETDARSVFGRARGRARRNLTRFRNPYDLAYRLMRLYEQSGRSRDLVALGFRVLAGQRPFERSGASTRLTTPRANWHGRTELEDLLDCLYVLLAHVHEPADGQRLTALVDASSCIPLKNQLARLLPARRDQRIDPSEIHRRRIDRVVLETPGLPDGVRLLTHRDDVRAISPDGRWIGTSWGLVRYRTLEGHGLEILQIPIGRRVTTFCDTPTGLYVGTSAGVYRLDHPDDDEPILTRIDLEAADLSTGRRRPVGTQQLLWWADALWVPSHERLFRYDPAHATARYYGPVSGRVFVAGDVLCAGTQVFDRATDELMPIEAPHERWELIGAAGGKIWADVWVDRELRHRPALVDPKARTLRVLPIEGLRPGEKIVVNGVFEILAEDEAHVWLLGNGSLPTVYDRAKGTLRMVRTHEGRPDADARHLGPAIWRSYDDGGQFHRFHFGSGTREEIPGLDLDGDRGPTFCWRELADGRLLLGSGIVREWCEDNLGFDDDTGMSHHIQDLEGGLFEIDGDTLQWQKLGSRTAELTDFYVKRITFDDLENRAYVCTNGGVTILSLPGGDPIGRITVSDGLPSNKVEDVVRIGNRLYFACELGDEGGGLAVQDLDTKVIQRLSIADGLKCDKIKRLRADGTKLHILYGTIYGPRAHATSLANSEQAEGAQSHVRTFRSSILDTTTGALVDGDEVLPAPQAPDESRRLPYLGGAVLCDVTHGGRRFLGGTHGLVIVPEGASVVGSLDLAVQAVKPELSRRQRQLAEAARFDKRRPISLTRLEALLDHENRYIAAEMLAALMGKVQNGVAWYTPVIGRCVSDPNDRVRSTAVWLLSRAKDDAAIEPLRIALQDRDPNIRGLAALGLARQGVLAPLAHFEEMLEREGRYGNYPFGAASSVGVEVDRERVFAALAPHADREVFELLLRHPIPADEYEPREAIFHRLGGALSERPEAADVLLGAVTRPGDPGPDARNGPAAFAQEVFEHAGKALLPRLHAALESPDRVLRSNAARACGAIADASSIEPLTAALDLESGLSRASIVWALGELKAESALPHMLLLYLDARNDDARRAGSGFRAAQAAAVLQNQFERLRNLDSIGTEWDELKRGTAPEPIDPRRHEVLLNPQIILDAVRKIGPAASQSFYRGLAAEKDVHARQEAAVHLAGGEGPDRATNLPILRHLLSDSNLSVRVSAAVSLLLMGERDVEKQIVAWLKSPERRDWREALFQLPRVQDGQALVFARDALRRLAGRDWESRTVRERLTQLLERIPADD